MSPLSMKAQPAEQFKDALYDYFRDKVANPMIYSSVRDYSSFERYMVDGFMATLVEKGGNIPPQLPHHMAEAMVQHLPSEAMQALLDNKGLQGFRQALGVENGEELAERLKTTGMDVMASIEKGSQPHDLAKDAPGPFTSRLMEEVSLVAQQAREALNASTASNPSLGNAATKQNDRAR